MYGSVCKKKLMDWYKMTTMVKGVGGFWNFEIHQNYTFNKFSDLLNFE